MKTILIIVAIILTPIASPALTFDFAAAIATDSSYPGTIQLKRGDEAAFTTLGKPTGEQGGTELLWTSGTLQLTVTSSDYVYLDGLSGGKPAGLGVCGTLTVGYQCNPSSDDNVSPEEWLTLRFNKEVELDLSRLFFRDADHNLFDGSTIRLSNGPFTSFGEGELLSNYGFTVTGSTFSFWNDPQALSSQFYISSLGAVPVPEPGTILLFGAGLSLLGATARKLKR